MICPYCRMAIAADVHTVTCSTCGTVHHAECWRENGRCTTYGCAGGAGRERVGDDTTRKYRDTRSPGGPLPSYPAGDRGISRRPTAASVVLILTAVAMAFLAGRFLAPRGGHRPAAPTPHVGAPKSVTVTGPHAEGAVRSPETASAPRAAIVLENSRAIYVVGEDGGGRRRLVQGECPVWAPDAKSVFFEREGGIWVVPAAGGVAQLLARTGADIACAPDGTRIAYTRQQGTALRIHVLSLSTHADEDLCDGYQACWSEDSARLLCAFKTADERFGVREVDVRTGMCKDVVEPVGGEEGILGIYEPTYSRDQRSLCYVAMLDDLSLVMKQSLDATGESATPPFAEGPPEGAASQFDKYYGVAQGGLTESPAGGEAALEEWTVPWADFKFPHRIVLLSMDGKRRATVKGGSPSWSPDGAWIAYQYPAGADARRPGIYLVRRDGTGVVRIADGRDPHWSPR